MKNIKKIIANFLVVLTVGIGLSGLAFAGNTANSETNTGNYYFNRFRVNGYKTKTHRFYFQAGESVNIEVEGDGDTNLDVYVYDAFGNLCVRSTDATDFESITMDVYRSEYFTIKVVNRGKVYNDYDLLVDAY